MLKRLIYKLIELLATYGIKFDFTIDFSVIISFIALFVAIASAWFTLQEKIKNEGKLEALLVPSITLSEDSKKNVYKKILVWNKLEITNYGGSSIVLRKLLKSKIGWFSKKEVVHSEDHRLPLVLHPGETGQYKLPDYLTPAIGKEIRLFVKDGTGKIWPIETTNTGTNTIILTKEDLEKERNKPFYINKNYK